LFRDGVRAFGAMIVKGKYPWGPTLGGAFLGAIISGGKNAVEKKPGPSDKP